MYSALTNQVSALRYAAADMPPEYAERGGQWGWYHETMEKVYGGLPQVADTVGESPSGEYNNALENVLNQGIPGGLITIDEAIETLNNARMTVPQG